MAKMTNLRNALQNMPWGKVIDLTVNIGVGGITFLGSVDHVLHLARAHGQTGHNAYAIAGSVEILAAYAGYETRRRKGWSRLVPVSLLLGAVAFIMWANVMSTPDRTGTGITLAVAAPSIFLSIAFMAETRHWKRRSRRKAESGAPAPAKPRKAPQRASAASQRESVRDEWFLRRTSPEPMTDAEIGARLGIAPKSAGDARRRWERSMAQSS